MSGCAGFSLWGKSYPGGVTIDHADYSGPTAQHELDHTDLTDGIYVLKYLDPEEKGMICMICMICRRSVGGVRRSLHYGWSFLDVFFSKNHGAFIGPTNYRGLVCMICMICRQSARGVKRPIFAQWLVFFRPTFKKTRSFHRSNKLQMIGVRTALGFATEQGSRSEILRA